LRNEVTAVFLLSALILALTAGSIIYGISRGYLIEVRQQTGIRQAQASAAAVQRLLVPGNVDLPEQVRQLGGISESGVLVTRGETVLASAGLSLPEVPPRLRRLVESGTQAHQRVRIDGEVRLLVGIPLTSRASYYQSLPLNRVESGLRALTVAVVLAGLAGLLLSGLWARAATRRALRPVDELTAAAHAVARGELSTRLPETDRDLAAIARLFNATAAALERRVRSDARFASDVSHELRTPLTTMSNAMAVLDRRRAQLPEVAAEAVELLGSQIRRFERLVLDLLEISVHTEGSRSLALEHVHLPTFVRHVADANGWQGVDVDVRDAIAGVTGDPRRLERIVCNLVANAQGHGSGLVRFGVSRCGDRVRLEVDDAGPGVPLEARERIFERFVHGPARPGNEDGGAGLGLALVRELTALHQGRVWVEDRPGGGARFVVELPATDP